NTRQMPLTIGNRMSCLSVRRTRQLLFARAQLFEMRSKKLIVPPYLSGEKGRTDRAAAIAESAYSTAKRRELPPIAHGIDGWLEAVLTAVPRTPTLGVPCPRLRAHFVSVPCPRRR